MTFTHHERAGKTRGTCGQSAATGCLATANQRAPASTVRSYPKACFVSSLGVQKETFRNSKNMETGQNPATQKSFWKVLAREATFLVGKPLLRGADCYMEKRGRVPTVFFSHVFFWLDGGDGCVT